MRILNSKNIKFEDGLIFLFFFFSPIVKSGGELVFLMASLFGVGLAFKIGFKAWHIQLSRNEIILSLAFSTPFFWRLISLGWSEFVPMWSASALTNIHYALWPFLLVFLRRSENPAAMMIAGISAACAVGFVWLAALIIDNCCVNFNFQLMNHSLSAQHSGVLAHIMCLYTGLLASVILFHKSSKFQNKFLILSFFLSILIAVGAAKRIQFGILVLMLFCMVSYVVFKRSISRSKLVIGVILLFTVLLAVNLMTSKFMVAYQEILIYFIDDDKKFTAFNSSVGARIEHYYVGIKAWLEHPWLGYGVGTHPGDLANFSHDPPNFDFQKLQHFHNQYLQVLVETGVVGAIGALLALLVVLKCQCMETRKIQFIQIQFIVLYSTYLLTGLFSIAVGQGLINAIFVMTNIVIWIQWNKWLLQNSTSGQRSIHGAKSEG